MKRNYKWLMLFLFSCMQLISFAQDSTTNRSVTTTTKTTTSSTWYMQPWAWAVGGAVLLIILIALFRSGSNKEVSKSTTVVRDRTTPY